MYYKKNKNEKLLNIDMFSQKGQIQLIGYQIAVSVLLDNVSAQNDITWMIKSFFQISAKPSAAGYYDLKLVLI